MDILDIVNRGSKSVENLDDSLRLRSAAYDLLRVYEHFGGFSVYAASPQAERVLGAAMMIEPAVCAGGSGDTVIVDVNIASGTLMARAARRLRDNGNAGRLVGIALHSLVGDYERWHVPELSELVVVDPHGEPCSIGRQATQGSDHRIGLLL
ncbi:hypothetical protein [Rhodococcus tibetensis]|uniref:Uncharacterized protein n=1 Tax=Rhodococcus tibetensis TaxID=2965064 RepID=A0ABT1Q8Y3_9NOCA|nr:hypothetical protein [Rhodococcus sp. FXJ9.536]MCQ4118718.1 hypothetical protein [Rhodococcus sp. FXJ9.536]